MKKRIRHVAGGEGASLVETMVASGLALVVIAAALQIFTTHHANFLGQRTTSELLQDMRGGIDLLGAELRLASPITVITQEEIGFRANVNDIRGKLTSSANRGQSTVHVTSSSGWVKGKTVRLCSPLACEEQSLMRDGTAGNLLLANPLLHDFSDGSTVEVVNQVRYYLNRNQVGNWKIMREVDHGANPLVEHVDEFTLTYLKETGAIAGRPDEVRLVRLTLQTSAGLAPATRRTRQHIQDLGVRAL